jgi:hypothetical protein
MLGLLLLLPQDAIVSVYRQFITRSGTATTSFISNEGWISFV